MLLLDLLFDQLSHCLPVVVDSSNTLGLLVEVDKLLWQHLLLKVKSFLIFESKLDGIGKLSRVGRRKRYMRNI